MVFIEEKHSYFSRLEDQPKQKALLALMSHETMPVLLNEVSEIDAIYYSSIQAIKINSKKDFNTQYARISKRKVLENSSAPFVHDDYLIFTLVIGVLKFDCDKEWLIGVIQTRSKGETSTTFENLLTTNYQTKANNYSIVLVLLFLLDKSKITNDLLNDAYNGMSGLNTSFNSDFIRIIYYRAFDIIINFKLPRNSDDVSRLLEFEPRFKKRINIFSIIVYNLFIIVLLFVSYKILKLLPDDKKLVINDLNLLIGLGAIIGLTSNFIPKLKKKFQVLILRAFGYRVNIK
jgi:hypothetical protein